MYRDRYYYNRSKPADKGQFSLLVKEFFRVYLASGIDRDVTASKSAQCYLLFTTHA